MKRSHFLPLVSALLILSVQSTTAVTVGQTQTFDDPDTGWVSGGGPVGVPPIPVPLGSVGGHTGDTDPYLDIVSTGGGGPGSRLSVQNFSDWTGNYLAQGINQIQMDVRNFGSTDLSLRLLFVEFGASGPVSAVFTDAILVMAGSSWQSIQFDISPAALTPVSFLPVPPLGSTLANVGELRLFHNPDPFFNPGSNPPVIAHLAVDNISAASVPDSAEWTLVASFLFLITLSRRWRPQHS